MEQEEVTRIAHLARIELNAKETEELGHQFAEILDYIKKIDTLDIGQTEPVCHPFNITNVFREDQLNPSMPTSDLMKIAPSSGRDMIRVPRVIENKS